MVLNSLMTVKEVVFCWKRIRNFLYRIHDHISAKALRFYRILYIITISLPMRLFCSVADRNGREAEPCKLSPWP